MNERDKLDYPQDRREVLVVDNGSTDRSTEFLEKNIRKFACFGTIGTIIVARIISGSAKREAPMSLF